MPEIPYTSLGKILHKMTSVDPAIPHQLLLQPYSLRIQLQVEDASGVRFRLAPSPPNERAAPLTLPRNILPTRSGYERMEPWVPCHPLRHLAPFHAHKVGYIDGLHRIAQTLAHQNVDKGL